MAKKITLDELKQKVLDPSIPERDLRRYFIGNPESSSPFNPDIVPDPKRVAIDPDMARLESAMKIGNGLSRFRRKIVFDNRIADRDPRPVLVSEGDSWFQFPIMIDDVIDHLLEDYTIRSLGAAGDTARNMVAKGEYLKALRRHADRVEAFLFSAAGNDVIGEGEDGEPQIKKLVKQRRGSEPAEALIDRDGLTETLDFLRGAYREVIEKVHGEPGLESLPIILHGYDYPFPGAPDDPRDPIWADPDEWLGAPLRERSINDPDLQRAVVRILIDELYDMLNGLAAAHDDVHVVDVRGVLARPRDWADEIHGTDKGFSRVASRFAEIIEDVRAPARVEARIARRRRRRTEARFEAEDVGLKPAVIVLDPGHGGHETVGGSSPNNAVGPDGTLEKELTLRVAKLTEEILESRGHRVPMTRASDRNLGLAKRAQIARDNEAEVFLSVHFNAFHDPGVQGTETYHHDEAGPGSRRLAQWVQRRLAAATGLRDRRVKSARFGVLRPERHLPDTAACLAEVSFLTDPDEEVRLEKPEYLNRLAGALADGIEIYLEEIQQEAVPQSRLEAAVVASQQEFGDAFEMHGVPSREDGFERPDSSPEFIRDPLDKSTPGPEVPSVAGIPDPIKFLRGWRRKRQREAGLEVRFEARIGTDDTLPFNFLTKGVQNGKAVCKIHTADGGSGTGFLVGPDLLLTNNHVLHSRHSASTAKAQFDFYELDQRETNQGEFFDLDPHSLFVTSPARGGLDYTFVRIKGEPHRKYGFVPMERGVFTAEPQERANIVHHPNGDPKQVSVQNNQVLSFEQDLLHYTSDTEPGSSGSPVFDNTWRLMALHHASTHLTSDMTLPEGYTGNYVNEGIKISRIAIDLEERRSAATQAVLASIRGSDSLTGYFGASGRRRTEAVDLERVVSVYNGAPQDIDVAFWNLEWFNQRYRERVEAVAGIIADINLDIWAFAETSPQATEALVHYIAEEFGLEFEWAASEPNAPSGRQTTTVIWNPATVKGRRLDWPDEIERYLRADSRDPLPRFETRELEAIEGKIFNRYPGLFRFEALNRESADLAPFNFNLVPLHLKAKAEGAKRRQLASEILSQSVQRMINVHNADRDWVIGGDVNAELATGQFQAFSDHGFLAMSADDEAAGAMTYLKNPQSLIDTIFLSPNLARSYGADDFFIYAGDAALPDYVRDISDHWPIMVRLCLKDQPPEPARRAAENGGENYLDRPRNRKGGSRRSRLFSDRTDAPADDEGMELDVLDAILKWARRDPEDLLRDLADRIEKRR